MYNASKSKFVPSQALAPSPKLYDELVSDTTQQLAQALLTQGLITPIPSGSIIHDNGCGTGAATIAIADAANKSGADITIKATDINETVIKQYKALASEHQWPAEALVMDSSKLEFPDNTFTHSIANALVFILPNEGREAIREAYRTLKPGGILLVNAWSLVPSLKSVNRAAELTRPAGTPLPLKDPSVKWGRPEFLREAVVEGGFERKKVRMATSDVYCTTAELGHWSRLNWNFMGGLGEAGWLETDEGRWDEAVRIVEETLRGTEGFQELEGGRGKVKFAATIAIATK